MEGHRLRIVGAILLSLALVAVFFVYRSIDVRVGLHPLPGAMMATRAAERLTGAACLEAGDAPKACLSEKAPIAALSEYRRCGGYVENVTAGPSQLACSESWVLDGYLRSGGEGSSFYREFRRACRTHDFCYVHSAATTDPKYGNEVARQRCDDKLLADVIRDCRLLYPVEKESEQRRRCMRQASFVHIGVRIGGSDHFSNTRHPLCDFEPGPQAPRDQVVSGKFLLGEPERIVTLMEQRDHKGLEVELHMLDDKGGSSLATEPILLRPSQVSVVDRDDACTLNDFSSSGTCTAPSNLADAGFQSSDWLRFAPVVLDSDGDGADEILLVSLTAKAGLIFTHLRFQKVADVDPAIVRTVAHVAAFSALDARTGRSGTRAKEFGSGTSEATALLASERAAQMLSHQLVVTQRPPEGCAPLIDGGPQDILMIGSRGEPAEARQEDDWEDPKIEAIKRRMYRFYFDGAVSRWRMLRDSYAEDGHKMSQCDGEAQTAGQRDRQHQLFRLQYPAFATRGPVRCEGEVVTRETLSVITREKCPSSTSKAGAGDLNDVNLVSYTPVLDYAGDDQAKDPDSRLELAKVSWLPLIWSEAADPVLTSKYARRAGILMTSVYAGGTKKVDGADSDRSRFLLVSVLPNSDALARSAKPAWRQRLPDATGMPPRQLAILKSDRKTSSAPYWPRKTFGDPSIFLHIPSILAPFWLDGSEGVSLVMFANRATFEQEQRYGAPTDETVKRGTLQALIVPLVRGNSPPLEDSPGNSIGEPRWIECPVPNLANTGEASARGQAVIEDDFLYREPVLPGQFFEGKGGSLAIAYRGVSGRISLTSLRPFGRFWKLGDETCRTMSRKFADETTAERDVWMMSLN